MAAIQCSAFAGQPQLVSVFRITALPPGTPRTDWNHSNFWSTVWRHAAANCIGEHRVTDKPTTSITPTELIQLTPG